MEQEEAEAALLAVIQRLHFDEKGLFDGLRPCPDAIRRLFPLISRGERVMLAFVLTVYDPSLRRELLGDYDLLAELQAADARSRALIAEWVEAPFFVGTD